MVGEPPPETTTLRLVHVPGGTCFAPQYMAEELLRSEGFTDVQYAKAVGTVEHSLVTGPADISMQFVGSLIVRMDAGDPIVVLAGVHAGCYELFGAEQIRAIRDLKGKTLAVTGLLTGRHFFLVSVLKHVGLDPSRDVNWVVHPPAEAMRLLADGQIDAFQAFPPDAQELRARRIGHVVVSSAVDRPWSQYFCCVVAGNAEFVHRHPVAAKRALRAILKATDLCGSEPQRAAKYLVDKGFAEQYDYNLQALKDLPYSRWREYDAEDTIRFYALRLQEAGFITSSPQKIIEKATDWRFLNDLKKELKA
jgi:NitT/TauT family transport system substrate-binding protein